MQSLIRAVSGNRFLSVRMSASAGHFSFLQTTASLQNPEQKPFVPVKHKIYHERHRGIDVLRNPQINKGMAFTLKERQIMGIHGLIPPTVLTQDQQMVRVMRNLERIGDDLNRYIYMNQLYDRNEKLFFRVLIDHVEKMMPIVYTPTVGEACLKYGMIYRKPRGLFLTIHDKGHLYQILCNWPHQDVKAIVVTDGERILGLGDLGAFGMGIPVGKLSLYTALAGIAPEKCLPITLDVGTNNKALLNDPLYIGVRHERIQGQEYDDFIEEFMQAAVKRYGQDTLIQFEDFGNNNAFRHLEKYRNRYCTFNDDIQGTASVAVAGIMAALRITKNSLKDHTFVFQGAGEASLGIGELLVEAMKLEGLSDEAARDKIWMLDRKGIITKDRPEGSISEHKQRFAKDHRPMTDLVEIVEELRPTALMGAATVPNVFTEEVIRSMARINERPIIFALSNPTANAECTAEEAYKYSDGRAIFASGSPFDPVNINGKTLYPGQGNNAYIFPGVALGVTVCDVKHITDEVFLTAAQTVANLVTEKDLDEGRLYPPLGTIREVSVRIAIEVAKWAYANNQANLYPKPDDYEVAIREHVYDPAYESFVPDLYEWPKHIVSAGTSYE